MDEQWVFCDVCGQRTERCRPCEQGLACPECSDAELPCLCDDIVAVCPLHEEVPSV